MVSSFTRAIAALFADKRICKLFFLLLWLGPESSFCQTTAPSQGLALHWAMDEGQGTQLNDASGNGHSASFSGAVNYATTGWAGKCLEAAQHQGWSLTNTTLTWQPTAFTVSFWLNPYSFDQWSHAIASGIGWGGFVFHTEWNGGVYVGTDVATRFTSSDLPAGTVELNRWQHFVFTYGNGQAGFYKNGILLVSKAMNAPQAWGGLTISGTDSRIILHGKLDEMRIYNRALSEQEVYDLSAVPNGVVTATWKSDAATTEWTNPANWLKGAVPGPKTEVIIKGCATCPVLSGPVTIDRLTMTGGTLTLGTYNLTAYQLKMTGGTVASNGATIVAQYIEQMQSCSFTGAITFDLNNSHSVWPGSVAGSNTFYGNTEFSVYTDPGSYGFRLGVSWPNVFKGTARFRNTGTGSLYIGLAADPTIFENKVEFINESSSAYTIVGWGGVVCQKEATFTNNSSNYLRVGFDASSKANFRGQVTVGGSNQTEFGTQGTCTFQAPVVVTGNGMVLGGANGTTTFSAAARLESNDAGFPGGEVTLTKVTFENTAANAVKLRAAPAATAAAITVNGNVTFKGGVELKANKITLNGGVFQQGASVEQWGGQGAISAGGNTFGGATTLKNSGAGQLWLGRDQPDVFNGPLTLTHGGGNGLLVIGLQSEGNQLNDHVIVNAETGVTGYIEFGGWGGKTRLAAGKTLTAGSFLSGELRIRGLTQEGNTAQTLTLGGSAGLLFGGNNTFNGPVTATAPRVYLNGNIFRRAVSLTKTGPGDDESLGGNTFTQQSTVRNTSASGNVKMAVQSPDVVVKAE